MGRTDLTKECIWRDQCKCVSICISHKNITSMVPSKPSGQ